MGGRALLQGIFLPQGSSLGLLRLQHCRRILYQGAAVWVRGPQGYSGVWRLSGVDPEGSLQLAGHRGSPSRLCSHQGNGPRAACLAHKDWENIGKRKVGGVYPHVLCDDGQGRGLWNWPHTPGDV